MAAVMALLLLAVALQGSAPRKYHDVSLEDLADGTRWTHACVTGPVVYRRKQTDGDWHITLDNGRSKVVLEIVPSIPLTPPKKGDTVRACGVTRQDTHHKWWEIHPVETIVVITKAPRSAKKGKS